MRPAVSCGQHGQICVACKPLADCCNLKGLVCCKSPMMAAWVLSLLAWPTMHPVVGCALRFPAVNIIRFVLLASPLQPLDQLPLV
eukprot:15473247-Alexandrium_andersonii.AAC.1